MEVEDWCIPVYRAGQMEGRSGKMDSLCSSLGLKAVTSTRPGKRECLESSLVYNYSIFPVFRGPHEYMLVLNPDLYSKRHVQWYYFRVSNMETTPIYTFHIVNFEKSKSLYSKGAPLQLPVVR